MGSVFSNKTQKHDFQRRVELEICFLSLIFAVGSPVRERAHWQWHGLFLRDLTVPVSCVRYLAVGP